jgi:predicted PurR-regulated permease PerM
VIKPTTFLNILFVVVLYFVSVIYKSFLLSVVIAALLTIATSKSYTLLLIRFRHPVAVSSILTSILALVLFGPILYFLLQIVYHIDSFNIAFFEKVRVLLVQNIAGLSIPDGLKEQIINGVYTLKYEQYVEQIGDILQRLGQDSLAFFANVIVILIFYFFANLYGKKILIFLQRVLPLKADDSEHIFGEVSQVMSIVMYSTVLNAVLQGFLFSLIVLYIGYDAIFWGIAFSFCSLVPIVGAAILWLPIALYEFSIGHTFEALLVSVYTVVLISVVADTFIKPVIIDFINKKISRTKTDINSLLIFFAVIAGMSSFGFWGIIIGPAATALFISILKIYDRLKFEEERANRKAKKIDLENEPL